MLRAAALRHLDRVDQAVEAVDRALGFVPDNAEGLLERNRGLPPPDDFSRVAVISPRAAAGLGDFVREAARLERAGAVEFVYLQATFQGREAAASLMTALSSALLTHLEAPLDALVIIRGGGAQTDLAWLNDLELARMVARFPVPVITGIGHARDDGILDEIACIRTDTPSKAAARQAGREAGHVGQQDHHRHREAEDDHLKGQHREQHDPHRVLGAERHRLPPPGMNPP